jgi:sugar phosphate permease
MQFEISDFKMKATAEETAAHSQRFRREPPRQAGAYESGGRMNRAFYIIVVPAIVTTFGWVTFGWGWRLAAVITAAEVVLVVATVIFLVRRQNAQKSGLKKAS